MRGKERESDRREKKQRCHRWCGGSGGQGGERRASYTTGESQSTISGLCLWRWWADHRRTELDAARSRSVGSRGQSAAPPFSSCLFARPLALTSRLSQYVVSCATGTSVVHLFPRFVFRPFYFFSLKAT